MKKIAKRILSSFFDRMYLAKHEVEFCSGVVLIDRKNIKFSGQAYLGNDCKIYAAGGVTFGDGVILSDQVVIMTTMHDFRDPTISPYGFVDYLTPVRIGARVWIGYRAIILPGVELGDDCIVGSGAVVTKSFPPGSIVAGNPAILINRREDRGMVQSYLQCKKQLGRGKEYVFKPKK